jgi:chemotaxis signal transduction protein
MLQQAKDSREDRRMLVVRSGATRFGLPVEDVVRVVRGLTCHPVPGSGRHLLGLAQYGGEPLPVLDLQALLEGAVSGGRHSSTVILGRDRARMHSLVGLAVDEVIRVADLMDIDSPQGNEGLVAGSAGIDGESMKIVNTKRLLGQVTEEAGAVDG